MSGTRWKMPTIAAGLLLCGCDPRDVSETLRQPEFSGVCGVRLSADASTSSFDIVKALDEWDADFCRWDVEGRSLIAMQAALDVCPTLTTSGGVNAEAVRFGTVADWERQCGAMGIQATDLAHFTLRDRLKTYPAACLVWSERSEHPARTYRGSKVSIRDLGAQFYKRHSMPIFASHVKENAVIFWMAEEPTIDLGAAVEEIVALGRDYGFQLTQRGCTEQEASGTDERVFPDDGSGRAGSTYSFSGPDPFGGRVFTIAVADDAIMFEGQAVTIEQLKTHLDRLKDITPLPNVVVVANADTSYQSLAQVMTMMHRAGLTKLGVIGGQ
ncbi:MAG: biopolymer transporter ExbD [Chitinophagaceae bacterium]|nr:MAG: biopolymer transporter ExbD [Chitinophagaceae bacterium]